MSRERREVSVEQAEEILNLIMQASQPYQRYIQSKSPSDRLQLEASCLLLSEAIFRLGEGIGLEEVLLEAGLTYEHKKVFGNIYIYFSTNEIDRRKKLEWFLNFICHVDSRSKEKLTKLKADDSARKLLRAFSILAIVFFALVIISTAFSIILPVFSASFFAFAAALPLVKGVMLGLALASFSFFCFSLLTTFLIKNKIKMDEKVLHKISEQVAAPSRNGSLHFSLSDRRNKDSPPHLARLLTPPVGLPKPTATPSRGTVRGGAAYPLGASSPVASGPRPPGAFSPRTRGTGSTLFNRTPTERALVRNAASARPDAEHSVASSRLTNSVQQTL